MELLIIATLAAGLLSAVIHTEKRKRIRRAIIRRVQGASGVLYRRDMTEAERADDYELRARVK